MSHRRGAGVVERDGLENRCTGNRTVGSNPTLSANNSTTFQAFGLAATFYDFQQKRMREAALQTDCKRFRAWNVLSFRSDD
jgi:hypothetical protein